MVLGFPIHIISKLCCIIDGKALALGQNCEVSEDGQIVWNGSLHCISCKANFAIQEGILNMLNGKALDNESRHELKLRNEHAVSRSTINNGLAWFDNEHNQMETIPTIEALSVNHNSTILELGCGDGRYSRLIADKCQWLMAVDFSLDSLKILQQRLSDSRNVGLVLGDITNMKVKEAGFDRILSTLVSNLPTLRHRAAMYRLASNALKSDGRFVFSTHHHGLRQRLKGEAKTGRYRPGGIYRKHFTRSECKNEVKQYFKSVTVKPIQIYFPFARRLGLPLVAQSRVLERVPLINCLGSLLLCTALQPIRMGNIRTYE